MSSLSYSWKCNIIPASEAKTTSDYQKIAVRKYASHRLDIFTTHVYDNTLLSRTNNKCLQFFKEGSNSTTTQQQQQQKWNKTRQGIWQMPYKWDLWKDDHHQSPEKCNHNEFKCNVECWTGFLKNNKITLMWKL